MSVIEGYPRVRETSTELLIVFYLDHKQLERFIYLKHIR